MFSYEQGSFWYPFYIFGWTRLGTKSAKWPWKRLGNCGPALGQISLWFPVISFASYSVHLQNTFTKGGVLWTSVLILRSHTRIYPKQHVYMPMAIASKGASILPVTTVQITSLQFLALYTLYEWKSFTVSCHDLVCKRVFSNEWKSRSLSAPQPFLFLALLPILPDMRADYMRYLLPQIHQYLLH